MSGPHRHSIAQHSHAHDVIRRELDHFLGKTRIRNVYFAEHSVAPSLFAYVTNFPRLSVTLKGCHKMELAHQGENKIVFPARGDAVFVPDHAWNNPDWSSPVQVLTFLFGAKQIGISLVRHNGKTEVPSNALKTSIFGAYDTLTHNTLGSLSSFATGTPRDALPRLLTETLLHSCLRLLQAPHSQRSRKAMRTYESLCLYVQENFQRPMSRESVAEYFGLAPNHVSRIFRAEGLMRFNDYLNLVRVNRAKFMLQNYRMTLKEIAAKCGYSDTAYFCRVFKKITKVTPTTYRTDDAHRLIPGSKRLGAIGAG